MTHQPNLRELARRIHQGETTIEQLVDERLEMARNSDATFISVNEKSIEQARALDHAIRSGGALPALTGVPISIKDLFDVSGELTLAGSVALKNVSSPAEEDCEVIKSLRNAGLIFLGRTNMSEFAFSGMGLNPHYGTPKSIWDRGTGRLPGGSSSGSAVSVAEGIVPATMGSDTAGSCRIPAAFNGVVGVKPSYGRYSLQGVYPLSPTSDAPGPLGVDVDSCFLLDEVITGSWNGTGDIPQIIPHEFDSLSLVVPEGKVMEELDAPVATEFADAVSNLKHAGVQVRQLPAPVVDDCMNMFLNRPVAVFEAWEHHRELIAKYGNDYDDYVRRRIESGRDTSAELQQARYREKAKLAEAFTEFMDAEHAHAVIYPTVSCVPPSISDALVPEDTGRINLRCLRNTATANYFDGCSISLPISTPGQAPVGLMVSSAHGRDDHLYGVAAAIESVVRQG